MLMAGGVGARPSFLWPAIRSAVRRGGQQCRLRAAGAAARRLELQALLFGLGYRFYLKSAKLVLVPAKDDLVTLL